MAAQFGATGVPFFVFDRRFGISGAQPFEVFVETITKALESPLDKSSV
jgi:predicted DsbA family dithiol-disulfide isomerase